MSRGRLRIGLRVFRQGRDIQVLCHGGAAHLGAVALAVPSPDRAGDGAEVQAQLLVAPGHREDAIALGMPSIKFLPSRSAMRLARVRSTAQSCGGRTEEA